MSLELSMMSGFMQVVLLIRYQLIMLRDWVPIKDPLDWKQVARLDDFTHESDEGVLPFRHNKFSSTLEVSTTNEEKVLTAPVAGSSKGNLYLQNPTYLVHDQYNRCEKCDAFQLVGLQSPVRIMNAY